MTDPTECAAHEDLVAEVATGVASGPDRGRLLSHLVGCPACRHRLDELTRVADEVLLVLPEREPPPGFESAVLQRIAGPAPARIPRRSRRRRRRRWLVGERRLLPLVAALIAATVTAGVGAGAVWLGTAADRDLASGYRETLAVAHGQYFTAAPVLDAAGDQVGHVFLYQGSPSWVFAVLSRAPHPAVYDVVVTTADWSVAVATCDATGTSCGAGGTVDTNISQVRTIRLIAGDGTVLTADLWRQR